MRLYEYPLVDFQLRWRQRRARAGLGASLWRPSLRYGSLAVLSLMAWRRTHCAPFGRFVQTSCAKSDVDARFARGHETSAPQRQGQRPWPSPGTNSPQACLCPGSASEARPILPRPAFAAEAMAACKLPCWWVSGGRCPAAAHSVAARSGSLESARNARFNL